MSKLIQIASNAVMAKVYNAPREAKLVISTLLSYRVAGCEHTNAFKNGWDGRSTFFDFKAGTFPAGFVHMVQSKLSKEGYTVQLVRKPLPPPRGPENPKIDDFGFDPKYDYQPETIRRLEKYGSMIAQIATGGGKSRIARLAFARIRRPTLFLTTRGVLMYQMKDAFEADSGISVGVLGDSEWTPRKGMNVAMVQTLVARLRTLDPNEEMQKLRTKNLQEQRKAMKAGVEYKGLSVAAMRARVRAKIEAHNKRREQTIKLLHYFEFVILEEAHEAGGDSYYTILRHCKNAHYRLALTATPFMRQDEESNMRLMACSGQIGIRVSEKMLIERGILAKPYFKFIPTQKPAKLYRTTPWQRAYKYGIVENDWRNEQIVFEAVRGAKLGMPVMTLVQHKAHGETLKRKMKAAGLKAEFIFGEHKQDTRKKTLARLGQGKIDVLIGSTILDVGVDVPAVGVVILAGGGKAEVALRQRIGRGLRRKKSGPNVALIIDFRDEHNTHLRGHALTRIDIIENTPGFAENVLPLGQDFDFKELGLLKAA